MSEIEQLWAQFREDARFIKMEFNTCAFNQEELATRIERLRSQLYDEWPHLESDIEQLQAQLHDEQQYSSPPFDACDSWHKGLQGLIEQLKHEAKRRADEFRAQQIASQQDVKSMKQQLAEQQQMIQQLHKEYSAACNGPEDVTQQLAAQQQMIQQLQQRLTEYCRQRGLS